MLRLPFIVGLSLAIALLLLPLLAVPFLAIDVELQKGMLAALLLGLGLLALGVTLAFNRVRPEVTPPGLSYAFVPLLCVAAVSAVAHGAALSSYAGLGFETGTVGFFALLCATSLCASLLNRAHIRAALYVFIGGAFAASAAAWCSYALGRGAAPFLFSAWPHLTFLLGAALVLAAAFADSGVGRIRAAWTAITAALAMCVLLFFHRDAALAAAAALSLNALLVGILLRRVPYAELAAAAALSAALLFGTLTPLALPPDIRLTSGATAMAGRDVYLGAMPRLLIGAGPDRFSSVWELHRPTEFNQTPLWQTTFREGYSTFLTWLITLGWLGALAYVCAPLFVVVVALRVAWERGRDALAAPLLPAVALILFVFIGGALYTLSTGLWFAAAVAIGFCARLLSLRAPALLELGILARVLRAAVLVAVGAALLVVPARQLWASVEHASGIEAFNASNVRGATAPLSRAASLWPASLYARDASRAQLEAVRLEASAPAASVDAEAIKQGIARTRALADRAVALDPKDYAAYLSQGSILTSLVVAGASEMAQPAKDALANAAALSPSRPEIPYVEGVLSNALGDTVNARNYAQQSLALKGDYAPAQSLIQSLQQP